MQSMRYKYIKLHVFKCNCYDIISNFQNKLDLIYLDVSGSSIWVNMSSTVCSSHFFILHFLISCMFRPSACDTEIDLLHHINRFLSSQNASLGVRRRHVRRVMSKDAQAYSLCLHLWHKWIIGYLFIFKSTCPPIQLKSKWLSEYKDLAE